ILSLRPPGGYFSHVNSAVTHTNDVNGRSWSIRAPFTKPIHNIGMKCDLHVHSWHSGMWTAPVGGLFCRESYSDPDAVYGRLKKRGMDLVTLTDHDSIDGAEGLRKHADFFVSEEVTCRMPSGTTIHIGVYDLRERDHREIHRRRDDLPRLLAYL